MKRFFTPGPAQLYPSVGRHISEALSAQIPSISHRSSTFKGIYQDTVEALRAVFALPSDWEVLFFASATEIWERLLQNCVEEHSFHFVNGSFSQRFFQAAELLHKQPQHAEAPWGQPFGRTEIPVGMELISFTRNETSTGVMTPVEQIYAAKSQYPEALVTVDVVSSAPYTQWNWSQVDAVYFSVQKSFGLPAGLGVLLLGPPVMLRAENRLREGKSLGTYHSFTRMLDKARAYQTVETPNVLGIYLLGKVCQEMLGKGIELIRKETEQKAHSLYEFFDSHPEWSAFVQDPSIQSKTVVVVDIPEGSHSLIESLADKDLILGNGYGKMKGRQIRIANFPALSLDDFDQLLTELRKLS